MDCFGHFPAVNIEPLGGISGHASPISILEPNPRPPRDDSKVIVERPMGLRDPSSAEIGKARVGNSCRRHLPRFSPIPGKPRTCTYFQGTVATATGAATP